MKKFLMLGLAGLLVACPVACVNDPTEDDSTSSVESTETSTVEETATDVVEETSTEESTSTGTAE